MADPAERVVLPADISSSLLSILEEAEAPLTTRALANMFNVHGPVGEHAVWLVLDRLARSGLLKRARVSGKTWVMWWRREPGEAPDRPRRKLTVTIVPFRKAFPTIMAGEAVQCWSPAAGWVAKVAVAEARYDTDHPYRGRCYLTIPVVDPGADPDGWENWLAEYVRPAPRT